MMTAFKRATETSGAMFEELVIAALIVGLFGSFHFAPRFWRLDRESKIEDARFTAVRIATGYCGGNHGSCDDEDPWGAPYREYWGRDRVIVQSLGEDGVPFTADDIWSNQ